MDKFTTNYWHHVETLLHPENCDEGDLFFISPYLTGDKLLTYLERYRDIKPIIIIQLKPSNVVGGSIELKQIKALLERGYRVISVAKLHAKIITDNRVAIVGSQNLTRSGEHHNSEASLITTDPTTLNKIINHARQLVPDSVEVSESLIKEVGERAAELKLNDERIQQADKNFLKAQDEGKSQQILKASIHGLLSSTSDQYKELKLKRISETKRDPSYVTLRRSSSKEDLSKWDCDVDYSYLYFGLHANSLCPFYFHLQKSQIGKLYRSMSNNWGLSFDGNCEVVTQDPRTSPYFNNIIIRFQETSVWYEFYYLFDGEKIQFCNSGWRVFGGSAPHKKMIQRRLSAIRSKLTTDEVMFKILYQGSFPDFSFGFRSPSEYFAEDQTIQMTCKSGLFSVEDDPDGDLPFFIFKQ